MRIEPGTFAPISPRLAIAFLAPLASGLGYVAYWTFRQIGSENRPPDSDHLLYIAFGASSIATLVSLIWLVKSLANFSQLREAPTYIAEVTNVWLREKSMTNERTAELEVAFTDLSGKRLTEVIPVIDQSVREALFSKKVVQGSTILVRFKEKNGMRLIDIASLERGGG